jgi:hypothetical protein
MINTDNPTCFVMPRKYRYYTGGKGQDGDFVLNFNIVFSKSIIIFMLPKSSWFYPTLLNVLLLAKGTCKLGAVQISYNAS